MATQLVQDLRELGGIITLEDLKQYRAILRHPKSTYYHGRRIITGGVPTAGAILLEILNILEPYRLGQDGLGEALETHQMVEAFKFGFADRGILGDPSYVKRMDQVADGLVRKEWSDQLRRNLSDVSRMEFFFL